MSLTPSHFDWSFRLLANKIVSELPPLTSDDIEQTSFLEELWEIEGQSGFLSITADNITELLEDEKTTEC